jgi:hypothetical protein
MTTAKSTKLLKCGVWQASPPCGYGLATLVLLAFIKSVIRFRKPPVPVRRVSLMHAFWHGLRTPVDRSWLLFRVKQSVRVPIGFLSRAISRASLTAHL